MGFSTRTGKVVGYTLIAAYFLCWLFFRATDVVEASLFHGALPVLSSIVVAAMLCQLIGAHIAIPLCCAMFGLYVDSTLIAPLDTDAVLPAGSVVLVTGANSGVGLASAQALAQMGTSLTLILGCRSMARCNDAAALVRAGAPDATVVPLALDLASSASIRAFAAEAAARCASAEPTDGSLGGISGKLVLLNNAGFVPNAESPPTADGLEAGMGAMHVGHHYLTRRLLLHEGLAARAHGGVRVVNVASVGHHVCGLVLLGAKLLGVPAESSPFPACLRSSMLANRPLPPSLPNVYVESKLANVLHALELPSRYGRETGGGVPALEASAIDLGWVETSIAPFMRTGSGLSLASIGLMRGAELGVRPIILAALGMPGSAPPEPKTGRLVTPLGKLVTQPLSATSAEPELAALAGPLWEMSERIADEWDAAASPA